MDLYTLVGNLQALGFFDVVLPFTLFFAITYAVLVQFGIFQVKKSASDTTGLDSPAIPAVISICVAFFAVAYTPYGMAFGPYLAEIFGKAGTLMASMLVFIILLGMSGIGFDKGGLGDVIKNKYIIWSLLLIAVVIYLTTGATGSGVVYSNLFRGWNSETMGTMMLLALVGSAIWFVTKTKGSGEGSSGDTVTKAEEKKGSE